jgi:hypothetical protein
VFRKGYNAVPDRQCSQLVEPLSTDKGHLHPVGVNTAIFTAEGSVFLPQSGGCPKKYMESSKFPRSGGYPNTIMDSNSEGRTGKEASLAGKGEIIKLHSWRARLLNLTCR